MARNEGAGWEILGCRLMDEEMGEHYRAINQIPWCAPCLKLYDAGIIASAHAAGREEGALALKLLREVIADLERPEQGELPPWKADLLKRAKEATQGAKP